MLVGHRKGAVVTAAIVLEGAAVTTNANIPVRWWLAVFVEMLQIALREFMTGLRFDIGNKRAQRDPRGQCFLFFRGKVDLLSLDQANGGRLGSFTNLAHPASIALGAEPSRDLGSHI